MQMAGINEIHAAICLRLQSEERTTEGRRRYRWHGYDCLRTMNAGEQVRKFVGAREYAAFRSMASKIGKDFGVRFSLHYESGWLEIRRTK